MSRSYAKYKSVGVCVGSNTKYYRYRRHLFRVRSKRAVINALKYGAENFDDNYNPYKHPTKDTWDEPTDGTMKWTAKDIKENKLKWHKRGLYTTHNKVKK